MSFGISAAGWALIAAGTTAAVGAYSADKQRSATNKARDATLAAQAEDARQAAEAETGAQVAANAKLAETQRRRRASALGAGDPSLSDSLGGASTVLATARPVSSYASGGNGGTALGSAAPRITSVRNSMQAI